jgi:hypothetical protein
VSYVLSVLDDLGRPRVKQCPQHILPRNQLEGGLGRILSKHRVERIENDWVEYFYRTHKTSSSIRGKIIKKEAFKDY